MVSTVYSAAVYGIDSKIISVEVDVSNGLPTFEMVGFLSTQVREAQNRVRSALSNSGFCLQPRKVTVNLSPADLKKCGTGFDLPIAVGVLASYGYIDHYRLKNTIIIGELSLNGRIQAVPGVLSMLLDAVKNGCNRCIVPENNLKEASLIPDLHTLAVPSLKELVKCLNEESESFRDTPEPDECVSGCEHNEDFRDIIGQERAKRACLIAAAGFHNILMIGPPGTGKSMIARRIVGILPDMTLEEQIEVSKIYSVMGMLSGQYGLMTHRPFRSPHHTATAIGLTGGGMIPKPGEISMAHNGILFLDEFAEFQRECVESLRQPLENHSIHIFRNGHDYLFPAKIMLVAAMNPCPCGYHPDRRKCKCTANMISRYLGKISYPLLDRIDLSVTIPEVPYGEILKKKEDSMDTQTMKALVQKARDIQTERFCGSELLCNSEIPAEKLDHYCYLSHANQEILKHAYEELNLSIRSLHKIIRTARTIADLDGAEQIEDKHIAEAFSYRVIRNSFVL